MSKAKTKGITLMEMVAIIVVIGLAIPTLMSMWATVSWQSVRTEGTAEATFYAQGLMEEIRSKRFDENSTAPWSSTLGVDTGESSNNATTFDDIDDYRQTTDTRITSPAPAYNRSANIEYVYLNSTDAWVACGAVNCTAVGACPNCCTTCNQCCYKRITVNVRRTDNIPTNVTLETVVSGYR